MTQQREQQSTDTSTENVERLARDLRAGSRRNTKAWHAADMLRRLADERDWLLQQRALQAQRMAKDGAG